MTRVPLLAIVGRPNVGKSTLFNRLVGGRPALVHDSPGLTRDRRYGEFDYLGRDFRVVDTGGLDPDAEKEVIGAGIHRQARLAIDEADAILFVVDAVAGITPLDDGLAKTLRQLGKPIYLCGNKIDHPKREPLLGELYGLGLGEVYGISAAHGIGVDEVLDAIIEDLGLPAPVPVKDDDGADRSRRADDAPLRIAFVGKPNAGKSSLVNRLLGEERALVHHEPGTTTDPVDTPFEYRGKQYVLVDTAGIRRRARIDEATERLSVSLALGQLERTDVAVLVIDGSLGPSEQDARLARASEERGCALVLALNKSDLLTGPGAGKELRQKTDDELHFLSWTPRAIISALRGDGVAELMDKVDKAAAEHRRRVPTAELNRFFEEVCETHPPPVHRGRSVRIHYLTQAATRPPTFILWANQPKGVSPSYRRFLMNQLRKRYGFRGTPLRLFVKKKQSGRARKSPSGRSRGRRR